MTLTVDELLDRWPSDIPFKGELISDDGCMCAQGQVLHYVGGLSADELRCIEQHEADRDTAELLGISLTHTVLLRQVNDSQPGAPTCVLTEPEKVLGDQAQRVLAFWRHLDTMTVEQWAAARAAARAAAGTAAEAAASAAAGDAAGDAAVAAARAAARSVAWDVAEVAAVAAAWDAARAAAWATNEIQGAEIMRERGQKFFFLPMFGFADPEAVLAADKGDE